MHFPQPDALLAKGTLTQYPVEVLTDTAALRSRIARLCADRAVFVVTDPHVRNLVGSLIPEEVLGWATLPRGEAAKCFAELIRLQQSFLSAGLDRDGLVLALGGGSVSDVAGLAAATWLRGVDLGIVPTTLLAQVDAAIGGKNGINLAPADDTQTTELRQATKNLVGSFWAPRFVLLAPALLGSLPPKEIIFGFAELIKAAIIGDPELFAALETHAAGERHIKDCPALIARAAAVKVAVVSRDERETGSRRQLNLGHTFGHALELCAGLSHGAAVAVGIVAASRLAVGEGLLADHEATRIERLLAAFSLPVRPPSALDRAAFLRALGADKKRTATTIRFVVPETIGRVRIVPFDVKTLAEWFCDYAATAAAEGGA